MFKEYFIRKNGQPWIDNKLRVRFVIDVFPGNALSMAEFDIFNLANNGDVEHGDSIEFIAGTKQRAGVIFSGTVINIFRSRDKADIYHKLICRTGTVKHRGSISASYGVGASIVDVLKDLAAAWPLRLDIDEKQFEDAPALISGRAIDGDIPTNLNKLADEYKFQWTEYAGRLIVSKSGEIRSNSEAIKVSVATGMEGVAEVNRGQHGLGVWVAKQLDPFIFPGSTVDLDVQFTTFNTGNVYFAEIPQDVSANGQYNVLSLVHRGDTHGDGLGAWTTEIDALRNDKTPRDYSQVNGGIVWGKEVYQNFRVKVRDIAEKLRTQPDFLMAVMAFETGRTFHPAERNRAGSGATGLIQFTKETAVGLGTTTAELARMSAIDQLDYVYLHYKPYTGRVGRLSDCYMATLYPKAIGEPEGYVLFRRGSKAYTQNSSLDRGNKGYITKGDATVRVERELKFGFDYLEG